jgi:hypothetical protein
MTADDLTLVQALRDYVTGGELFLNMSVVQAAADRLDALATRVEELERENGELKERFNPYWQGDGR